MARKIAQHGYELEDPNSSIPVTLRGDPALCRAGISFKAILRTLKQEGGGYLVELNHLKGAVEEIQEPDQVP